MGGYSVHVGPHAVVLEAPLHRGSSACLVVSTAWAPQGGGPRLSLAAEPRTSALARPRRNLAAFAVLGFVRLHRGWYLGVVTRARLVVRGGPDGAEIYQATGVDFIYVPPNAQAKKEDQPSLSGQQLAQERRFLAMLDQIANTRTLYFSHNYDLTQAAQRIALLNDATNPRLREGATGVWPAAATSSDRTQDARADPRFFWNLHMAEPFRQHDLRDWIHPFICGYVGVQRHLRFDQDPGSPTYCYIFISRRSRERQGTRFVVRGLDKGGHAANFVETEQIILADVAGGAFASHVQTRGSIPTVWDQLVTTKYMPRVNIHEDRERAFDTFVAHFHGEHSIDNYGAVTCVNLIDRTGTSRTVQDQRGLGETYESFVGKLADPRLRLVWFDFHHECRKMRYENLGKLVAQVDDDIDRFDFFLRLANGRVVRWQQGCFRTNCMDNLDRTNVVQAILARQVILRMREALLGIDIDAEEDDGEDMVHLATAAAGGSPSEPSDSPPSSPEAEKVVRKTFPQSVLRSPHADFERAMQTCWRDNANTMSVLYAGTPALKTRLGVLGKLQDGVNSVTRYVLNNFYDGAKQDAIALFLGYVDVAAIRQDHDVFVRPATDQTLAALLERVALVFLGCFLLAAVLVAQGPLANLKIALLATATLGMITARHIFTSGLSQNFVRKPQLAVGRS